MIRPESHIKTFKNKVLFSLGVLFIINIGIAKAQNIDDIGKKQPVTINGFVSTNQVYNYQPQQAADSLNTFNPYSGFYTGSLNFNLYGVNVPLTFIYSNQETNFTHPFNQYGLHPNWKWLKGHIGYASMSFSPYTMNGHLFLGGGIEATPPGIFKVSAMYGQLQKAVPYDTTTMQNNPAYQRMGFAVKSGIEKDGDHLNLIVFMAEDKKNSLNFVDSFFIPPQENAALSLQFGKKFFKKLQIQGEIANSAMTKDASTAFDGTKERLSPSLWLMNPRTSTITRTAIKTNLNYNLEKFTVGIGYERVDPDYATLGAYYFTNNLENYTLNFSTGFFKNKVAFSGNVGLQKDNLDNSSLNNSNRFVGSGNLNFTPNEKINTGVSYSNFTSYTNVRSNFDYINQTSPYENWDTLNYRQISQNISFNGSYVLSTGENKTQTISANLNYQTSDDQSGEELDKSNFYNASASHVLGLNKINLNITTSLNINFNEVTEANTSTWGPCISASKMFFDKKLRTNLSVNYNSSKANTDKTADFFNLRGGLAYTVKKQHNFNLSALYQFRNQYGENANNENNNTAAITFTYSYNFNILKDKKAKEESPESENE